MDFLLHPENLDRIPIRGQRFKKQIVRRVKTIKTVTAGLPDPDITVVIRTKNDMKHLERLFADIHAQEFTGAVEIIVVDTNSTDGTPEFARAQGAHVITLSQEAFTYPRALNLGFEAATHPYVVTLVGHSSFSNRYMFKALAQHMQDEKFGGYCSFPLPNWNARWPEILGVALWPQAVWSRVKKVKKSHGGLLAANCSIVSHAAWKRLGGYDERYAGGGEDTALARAMIAAGYSIYIEPACTVYHSHGLGFLNAARQMLHWAQVAGTKPQTFNTDKVHARRPDLR